MENLNRSTLIFVKFKLLHPTGRCFTRTPSFKPQKAWGCASIGKRGSYPTSAYDPICIPASCASNITHVAWPRDSTLRMRLAWISLLNLPDRRSSQVDRSRTPRVSAYLSIYDQRMQWDRLGLQRDIMIGANFDMRGSSLRSLRQASSDGK